MWKKMLCVVVVVCSVALVSCDSDLASLSSRELAYLGCQQVGFNEDDSDLFYGMFAGFKDDGLTFEQALIAIARTCDQACSGTTTDCLTPCQACLGALAQAVYYPDGVVPEPDEDSLNLRIPLPGGKYWLLTIGPGGYDCSDGRYDQYHRGENYYSFDFDDAYLVSNGGNLINATGDTPVLAAASGRVAVVGSDPNHANGYYIVLKHGSPASIDLNSGYSTRYLHLKYAPALSVGDDVRQGDKLGVLGNSGPYSEGTHLHFGVRKNNSGTRDDVAFANVRLEGQPLGSFKTGCDASGVWNLCYLSTNQP